MTTRLYYMDAMRSVLMLLGVVFHSASIYQVNEVWVIQDVQRSFFFDALTHFIHLFRMPAFFIIAGFFCHATLTRYGTGKFLRLRLLRVLIPLVACGLSINTLQTLLLDHNSGSGKGLVLMTEPAYWIGGVWVYHLWFLQCLALYFLIAALLYAFAEHAITACYRRFKPGAAWSRGGLYLLILPFFTYGTIYLGYHSEPDAVDFLLTPTWYYCSYFAFGFFLGANKAFLDEFCKLRPWLIIAVAAAYFLAFHYLSDQRGGLEKAGQRYLQHFVPWGLCVACFCLFRSFLDKSSKLYSYLSDASYSIYLFHQLFVILFGLMLLNLSLGPLVKFSIVVSLTAAAALAVHHYVVLRIGLLRFLFNGKSLRKTGAPKIKLQNTRNNIHPLLLPRRGAG